MLHRYRIILSVLGSAILSFGLCHIHSVTQITEGGVLGLSLFFDHWFDISPAVSCGLMNLICYALGIRALGKGFLLYSAFSTFCYCVFFSLFDLMPHILDFLILYPLTAAILGAVFVGVGVGLCVRAGGAPSGDDALAMTFSHYLKWNIQWVYLFSDLSVLLLSLTYIPFNRIVYSLVTVVLSGQIIGLIQKIPFSAFKEEK